MIDKSYYTNPSKPTNPEKLPDLISYQEKEKTINHYLVNCFLNYPKNLTYICPERIPFCTNWTSLWSISHCKLNLHARLHATCSIYSKHFWKHIPLQMIEIETYIYNLILIFIASSSLLDLWSGLFWLKSYR